MSVEIRRGGKDDIDGLEPLWLELRSHQGSVTASWGPLRPAASGWAQRRRDFNNIIDEGGVVFLAVSASDGVVGYLIGEQESWSSPTWQWPSSFLAIVEIVVAESHRGSGAGRALMEAAESEARSRGVDALDLMVAGPNTLARSFYEAAGFRADLITYRKPL